jgi:uncharacterized ferredoxin-like protein
MIGSAALFVAVMMAEATASAPAAKPVDPLDKVVCHREMETGSLTRVRKECRTRREWSKIADEVRRDAQTMRERSGAFSSN